MNLDDKFTIEAQRVRSTERGRREYDLISSNPDYIRPYYNHLVAIYDLRQRTLALEKMPRDTLEYEEEKKQVEELWRRTQAAHDEFLKPRTKTQVFISEVVNHRVTTDPGDKAFQVFHDLVESYIQRKKGQSTAPAKSVSPTTGKPQASILDYYKKGTGQVFVHEYDRRTGHVQAYYRSRPGEEN